MFTNEARDIMLLDWGIGGLSVYNELRRMRPELSCVYVSDSGSKPYGKMAADELASRLTLLISRAVKHFGVRRVILACNAASTAQEAVADRLPDTRISGMIEAGVAAVRASGVSKVGVIGGIRTVESGVFAEALGALGIFVDARSAQPLSALIERGVLSGPELEAALKPILEPLAGIPALLLACTHYPAIAPEIQRFLPGTKMLDPSSFALEGVQGLRPRHAGEPLFFTSGSCLDSDRAAKLAFGVSAKFAEAAWLR